MGIFKDFKDLATMAKAAPGLIDQANGLAAQASAYQQQVSPSLGAEAQPGNLEPIAGVDLEKYTRIVKGVAVYGYDESKLTFVAASFGVGAEAWQTAQAGWAARIQSDRGVGRRFNETYQAV